MMDRNRENAWSSSRNCLNILTWKRCAIEGRIQKRHHWYESSSALRSSQGYVDDLVVFNDCADYG